ncbi:AlpA family phage regulatory protein [Paraburkholderia sabiae]|uniref:AlpA family phage regulatory protein n=1 Tax=Paraburkholderia sabiae TaxID=273251 RepID=UPI00319DE253
MVELLTPAAIAHWPIVARQLRDADVLSSVDACSLAAYCEAFARWCAAGEQVAKMLIEFGARSGKQAQEPARATQEAAQSAQVAAQQREEAWRRNPNSIMRRQDVEREVRLSRTTIYNRMKDGTFPAAVKLGARSVGWRVADVDAFLANPAAYRAASRDKKA